MKSAHSPTFPCHFIYVTTHSPTLPSLYRLTAHSPTLPSLYVRHSSFSNPSVSSPTSQFILQPFCCFTYVTAHSLTLPLLHLRHSPFSNPTVASPASQFILQPFFCFSYVTSSSLNTPGEPPMNINALTCKFESMMRNVRKPNATSRGVTLYSSFEG